MHPPLGPISFISMKLSAKNLVKQEVFASNSWGGANCPGNPGSSINITSNHRKTGVNFVALVNRF